MALPDRPTRTLPDRPDLRSLKDEAKRRVKNSEFATLAEAQLAIAREHGFAGWPRLKEHIESRTTPEPDASDAFTSPVADPQQNRQRSSSAGIQKAFLKRVAHSWRSTFPFLQPVDLDEIPRQPRGSNFACLDFMTERNRAYFIQFDFNPKRVGEFSLGVTVSDNPARSVRASGLAQPSPIAVGSYGIGQFIGAQTRVWALVDVNAELDEFVRSLGQEPIGFAQTRSRYSWYPRSFGAPREEIFDAAIADVNAVLIKFVFPTLEMGASLT